jgi:hypothetical protein
MSALRYIPRIYSHHRLVLQVMLPTSGCLAVAAHVLLAMSYSRTAWCLFLCAIASSSVTSGFIMGQALKEGEETDLAPGYRTRQITAAFAVPVILILWALALTSFCGGPVLVTLSSFLSVAVLSLWYGLYCLNGLLFRDNSRMIQLLCFGARPFWAVYWLLVMTGQLMRIIRPYSSIPDFFLAYILLGCLICISYMTEWFGAYFLNNLSAFAIGTVMLWMLHDIFRISEFAEASSWIIKMLCRFEILGDFRPIVLLVSSLCAIILIYSRYRKYIYIFEWDLYTYATDYYWSSYSFIKYDGPKFPYMFSLQSWQRDHAVCLRNRDKTNRQAVDTAEKIILKMNSKARAGRGFMPLPLNQLLRFGLFSPVFVAKSDWIKFVVFCIVGTCAAFAYCLTENPAAAVNFFLPGLLFFSATILANDFQGHRNRLPLLYFQTALPSRAAFMKQSLTAYLWAVSIMLLRITITALLMHPLISWFCKNGMPVKKLSAELIAASALFHWSWNSLAQMIVMGIGLALGQVAASLFAGSRRAYAGGPGWLVINALLLVPITCIAYLVHSWPLSIAFVLVAAALFSYAERRWLNTELDFE